MRADRGFNSAETQEKKKKGKKAETGKKGAKKDSIFNKIKEKAGSAWSWCKKHKRDLAIIGAVVGAVVITVLTAGAAIPGIAASGAKGVLLAGVGGGTATTALSCGGVISLSPGSAAFLGFALSVAAYELSHIAKIPVDFKQPKASGPLEQEKDMKKALGELSKKDPLVPLDPEEYVGMLELRPKPTKPGYDLEKQPKKVMIEHDKKDVELAKKQDIEWGIAKEGELIEDIQSRYKGRGKLVGDLKIGNKIIEIESATSITYKDNSTYEKGHIIKQSLKMIKWNRGFKNYIQFIHGKPQDSIIQFLEQIGAEEVLGTDQMLWKLPDFSEETIRRYFKFLSGKRTRDAETMLNWINEFLKNPRELVIRKMPRGKEVELWKRAPRWKEDLARILKDILVEKLKVPGN
ncbi:MAG: hypothetical protein DRN92_04425 [Thermoproteota archaeon]|nr:MAG: hypothetical protein DRN92_04425 [Candidatus Korarchaeota archaeon]